MKYYLIIISFFIFYVSCDHGVDPKQSQNTENNISGISGTIYYQNWPPANFIYDLRLVIFKEYPPADIVGEVTNGDAIAYPDISQGALPFFVDSTGYSVALIPGSYEYIVIAQQFGPAVFFDWLVAGQYDTTLSDTIPTGVEVFSDSMIKNINIYVDFDSLPGQPF